jgi:hypothetical protein
MIMAKFVKFENSEKVETKAIFRNLPGWKFDEGVWINPDLTNSAFKLPSALDLDLSNVPSAYFKSGVSSESALELDEINFGEDLGNLFWNPVVKGGSFFSQDKEGFLHGSESIMVSVGEDLDQDGLSVISLAKRPSLNSALVITSLHRDLNTLSISRGEEWRQTPKFRGVAVNGRELDTEDPTVINQEYKEFVLENVDSSIVWNLDIFEGMNLSELNDVWTVSLDSSPVQWWSPVFSRPDIFRVELAYDEWLARLNNPAHPTPLEVGDYAIGYKGLWSEGSGVKLYSTIPYQDFGTISYKPNEEVLIRFNQNVVQDKTLTIPTPNGDPVFYLEEFPVLDNSYYIEGSLGGEIDLDTTSLSLTIGGVPWLRVASLQDAGEDDEAFELDSLLGIVSFGDGGATKNGKAPVEEMAIDYKLVPLIQYGSDLLPMFQEYREDLDPHVNGVKNGFLVLDTRRLIPYRIYLEATSPLSPRGAGTCCVGPIQIPPSSFEDMVILKARVVAKTNPERGVPNIPVEFSSIKGLVGFSQNSAVTDGDGWAYTEAYGNSNIGDYIITNHVYEPINLEENPDPVTLDLETPPWDSHFISPTEMVFGEAFNGDVSEAYMLVQSIPAEGDLTDYSGIPLNPSLYQDPYNPLTRRGGLAVVWSEDVAGSEVIQHPNGVSVHPGNPNWSIFEFDNPIPTGRLIVGYKLVVDRTDDVLAMTAEDPILVSNQIKICLELNDAARGQWKLPNLEEELALEWLVNPPLESNLDSSMIGTAIYMSPNDPLVTGIIFTGGASTIEALVGDSIDIIGENFPTTEELYLSVFMIKTEILDGDVLPSIVSVKDISSEVAFIDSTTIRIASLPVPPTEEYDINYWIAVGSFNPLKEDFTTRPTAKRLKIGETP